MTQEVTKQPSPPGSTNAGTVGEATSKTKASIDAAKAKQAQVESTALFRALNFELFVRPNWVVMIAGAAVMAGCVSYLGYMRAMKDNSKPTYTAMDNEGRFSTKEKISKWD